MSFGAKLVAFFPVVYLLGILGILHSAFQSYQLHSIPLLLGWIYLFPLFCMKLQGLFLKLDDGYWDLSAKTYHPWWGSYQFQMPFLACPWLEGVLHFIPGLYAVWLRAWGSKVGRGVVFTPRVEFLDRSLMEIGDGVVFGHLAVFSCHMVIQKEGRHFLMIRKIKIGSKSFIGADVQVAPGVVIEEKTIVPAKKRLSWRGEYTCS